MLAISIAPEVTCRIIQTDTMEADQVNRAIASMMLALRDGRHFRIEPGRIQWNDEHDRTRSFFTEGSLWYTSEVPMEPGMHHTLPQGKEADTFQNRIDHLLEASQQGWTIRGGRRPDPEGHGTIGFITWDRANKGNVPRLEIDPHGFVTYWYHWPEPDLPL